MTSPRQTPSPDGSRQLYDEVRAEGEREMMRPLASLWWSGIAAGMCMIASLLASAFLLEGLPPEATWTPLIADFGYCVGFVIVVSGRMQLFTENTVTTVLPLLSEPSLDRLKKSASLWTVVMLANLVGAGLAGAATVWAARIGGGGDIAPLVAIAEHGTDGTFLHNLLYGIPAGFFIAAVVWLRAAIPRSQLAVIVLLTYLIALGDFSHVIAGAAEVFVRVAAHGPGELWLLGTFIVPAFVGNVIGGTGLFALITHAQVRDELPDEQPTS